jgi:hypothetical protein
MTDLVASTNGVRPVYQSEFGVMDESTREVGDLLKLYCRFTLIEVPETFLTAPISSPVSTAPLEVRSTADFPSTGYLSIRGEEIAYTSKTPTQFVGITRAINGSWAVTLGPVDTRVSRRAKVDPSALVLRMQSPSGTIITLTYGTDAALVKLDTGSYYAQYKPLESGIWLYRWQATGNVEKTSAGMFHIIPARF